MRDLNMSDAIDPKPNLEPLLEWLKVIAEPKRLQILELIIQGVQCNCELSEVLQVGPTLISHHMKALTQIGLVDVERDASDARWVYYSINLQAMEELKKAFGDFFDPARIQPRRLTCGPGGQFIRLDDKLSVES
jgi:ArsR family transcriptional regulator